MTPEQTAHLVERIVQTWPAGPRGRIWTEALSELEHVTALGVYEYLRDHDERPPSIARFLETYRSVTPDYGWQTPDDTGPPVSLAEHLARHRDEHLERIRT